MARKGARRALPVGGGEGEGGASKKSKRKQLEHGPDNEPAPIMTTTTTTGPTSGRPRTRQLAPDMAARGQDGGRRRADLFQLGAPPPPVVVS